MRRGGLDVVYNGARRAALRGSWMSGFSNDDLLVLTSS
jgi:hypothetical protein